MNSPLPLTISDVLERVAAPARSSLPRPRLLVVLAHPDDEVLALGARLERLTEAHLVTVTDGAPADAIDARHHGFATLEAYRSARRRELARALIHAGVSPEITSPLAGTAPIPVPDQTAALHLRELTHAVAAAIRSFAPEAVLTHPYEGGHPDHDACAFAVHGAVLLLKKSQSPLEDQASMPLILEAPFYHAGDGGTMQTGSFLRSAASPATIVCKLSQAEEANKRARLACFTSQAETLAQFGAERELFRVAPRYDFTQPPHPGQLFYERFSWGMTGARFRALATDAVEQLFGPAGNAASRDPNRFAASNASE